MTVELFCVWEDAEVWADWNHFPWNTSLLYGASKLIFLHLEPPQDGPLGMATVADGLVGGNILSLPKAVFFRQCFFVHTGP